MVGRKPKNPKLEHGVNAGTDDLTERVNEEHDDMEDPDSPPHAKESGNEMSIGPSAPTEEATGKEENLVPTNEAMTKNLNSSQPGPSSSKSTLEQQVEYLMRTVTLLQAAELDYQTLYLKSQEKVEALTKENHELQLTKLSAAVKVEVYEKVEEAIERLKNLKIVSSVTKGPDVLAEIISQVASTTPADATQPPLDSSTPQSATGKGTTPADATQPPLNSSTPQTATGKGTPRGKPSPASGTKGSPSAEHGGSSSGLRRSKRERKKWDN